MNNQAYCHICNSTVNFHTKSFNDIDELLDVEYTKTFVYCSICNSEIHDNDIDLQNNKASHKAYMDAVVTIQEIEYILNFHNINATELSKLLNFKEDQITNYLNGALPLMKFSRILKNLYNNPTELSLNK